MTVEFDSTMDYKIGKGLYLIQHFGEPGLLQIWNFDAPREQS